MVSRDVYSVSRLNQEARALLEGSFPLLWVEGEISNFARPASGHWYFTLKDDIAQVRCAMFRNRNMHAGFLPENGTQVLLRARISLYEARGEFQLIAEHMEEAGDGALRRAFELLKKKLQADGLFDAAHKQPLPDHIERIGIITSPSGAAIRDILTTLKRRYPAASIIVYPVAVQGTGSAEQIVNMLNVAAQRNECDVLILARGGGSLEDLWSFNEEIVARAVYACPLPVVSGVGHEIDFTIADLVADVRAATPTAAAELVSPNQFELFSRLDQAVTRLQTILQGQLAHYHQQLSWLGQRLQHPGRRLQQLSQRLDDHQLRILNSIRHQLRYAGASLINLKNKLQALHPGSVLKQHHQALDYLTSRLQGQATRLIENRHLQLQQLMQTLDAVSPLATLERGYAIVTDDTRQHVLTKAHQTKPGQKIRARLHQGEIRCRVDEVHDE